MIGCCNAPRKKFIRTDGSIDHARLEEIKAEWKQKEVPDDVLNEAFKELSSCRCMCHQDGKVCFC